MFSSIFYQNRFSNSEKMRKIMKESMDKYIQSLDEKYKTSFPIIKNCNFNRSCNCNCNCSCNCNCNCNYNTNKNGDSKTATVINFLPFIIFGWGVYQLSKGIFTKH